MRRVIIPLIMVLFSLVALFAGVSAAADKPVGPEDRRAIESALQEAVARNQDFVLAYVIYETGIDRLTFASNGRYAAIWIHSRDRTTGEVIPAEPGLGIAVREGAIRDGAPWKVYLQSDPGWRDQLEALPEEIMPEAEREFWRLGPEGNCDTSGIGPFSGYYLPWEEGTQLALTRSILHHSPPDPTGSMHYAFDFSTSPSSMFDVWASKPGTVQFWRDSQPNGDPTSPGNYIVIKDTSTNPTSYALYLHLAQNSIPAQLKSQSAPVGQGEVIGIADDTGVSTNHHLHFQVHTVPTSYWGCSVDVRFTDVAINAGRPRTQTEASNYPQYGSQGQFFYVSGNFQSNPPPANPPAGGLFAPEFGQIHGTSQVLLDGWALDYDGTIAEAQFVVDTGSGWQPVGPLFVGTNTFQYTWDLCAAGVADGPLKAGVYAKDDQGNTVAAAGALSFAKQFKCQNPPPACTPALDEIALFELPDFQGSCTVLPAGTYLLSPGPAGISTAGESPPESPELLGTQVGSIMVGDDVYASLFRDILMLGRSQTFETDDSNLADNWTDPGVYVVAYIESRTVEPNDPLPAWPNGQTLPEDTQTTLVWDDGGGSLEYQARITGPTGTITSPWIADPWWDTGSPAAGTYTWTARARNDAGVSPWGPSAQFGVGTTNAGPPSIGRSGVITAPVTEDFETGATGWSATGFWNLLNDPGQALSGSWTWWYGTPAGNFGAGSYEDGQTNTGSLTSPPIHIPSTGFYLRYWSNYETESDGDKWDRRRVMISAAGGPFQDLYQLSGELDNFWLKSPYLDLSAYAGQTIRVRFVFETLDARKNTYRGWRIDYLTINTTPPQTCLGTNEPDNSPAEATPLNYGTTISGDSCPSGDLDFFEFSGNAGDHVGINVDGASIGSLLDPYIFLLDSDGVSLLAENDDEIPGVHIDPLISYVLPRSGTYYIKLRPWNFPGVGGSALYYDLHLFKDPIRPVVSNFTPSIPLTSTFNVPPQVQLDVTASDPGSGISHMAFYYHDSDWPGSSWVRFAIDLDGSDGWSAIWNTAQYPAEVGQALLVRVVDRAGNVAVRGIWNLFDLPEKIYLPMTRR